ncbi:hypothetical protein [Peptostreptococcus porci]|uniref:hypothetical protein n=1 Tax=Peptostreptococcus porci TaxID=2652282 RepID=UPI002A914A49|nr:hypothetical protein [Peptostreptococcus porci]MDY6232802.1 hypothetical protein [Peptostreptococcus porci]
MKKIIFYSNDQIIFNPDSIFIECGKWENANARIVVKKGLDYYILSEYETYKEAKNILDYMFYGISENYEALFFKGKGIE